MARLALLALLFSILWSAAPAAAHAAVVGSNDLGATAATALSQVSQTATSGVAAGTETARRTVSGSTAAARATVRAQLRGTPAPDAATAPAADAIDAAAAAAQPAVESTIGATSPDSPPTAAKDRATGRLAAASATGSMDGSARLRRSAARRPQTAAADLPRERRTADATAPASARSASGDVGHAPVAAATVARPGGPEPVTPSAAAGGSAAPSSGGFYFGGAALLAAAFCLAGPRLLRRLSIPPAAWRQPALVALLERPG